MLTTEEVAERLGVSPEAVRRWCRLGQLPATRVGIGRRATWQIDPRDLERFQRPKPGRPKERSDE